MARAWTDAGFRDRLLADANAALPEVGLSMAGGLQEQRLKVVATSADGHHVLVCPLQLLPDRAAGPLAELPTGTRISVWDASAESRYLVLPRRPEGTDDHTEEAPVGLVTRKGLIGTALV